MSHLNHGSFGAVPIPVQRAQQRLRDEIEANPLRFFTRGLTDRIVHTRRHLAGFLGADPDGTALVDNTTSGVAVVLQSIGLGAGDEILGTDLGYGAVSLAVERECRRTGAVARTLPLPPRATDEEIVEIIRAGLRPGRTRLLIVDQISSLTARLLPVGAVAAVARAAGVTLLVDAAHVPGMLPVSVDEIGADFWVGNLHKWGYAPRGTAVLVVAPPWRERIEPLAVSWEQPSGFPLNVEYRATLDYSTWLAAPVGLFTLRTLGLERVRTHNAALAAYGQRVVGEALGVSPDELPDPGPGVAMRVVPLPPRAATTFDDVVALKLEIGDKLAAEVQTSFWQGRAWLRLSGQVYNHAGEYEQLARRLPALLAGRG